MKHSPNSSPRYHRKEGEKGDGRGGEGVHDAEARFY